MNGLLMGIAAAALAFGGGGYIGYRFAEDHYAQAALHASQRATKAAVKQGVMNEVAAVHEATAQAQIEWKTKTLIQEVPEYVTVQADSRCTIPTGFVSVWNDAIDGVPAVAPSTSQSNDTPSGVALSDVADTAISDIGAANQNAQQLSDLQDWIRKSGLGK